jgi:hypothetical protein
VSWLGCMTWAARHLREVRDAGSCCTRAETSACSRPSMRAAVKSARDRPSAARVTPILPVCSHTVGEGLAVLCQGHAGPGCRTDQALLALATSKSTMAGPVLEDDAACSFKFWHENVGRA